MNQTEITLLIAIGGWAIAILLAITNLFEKLSLRKQELFVTSLQFLTGGSQRRSVGIAIIENLSSKSNKYNNGIIPALINQAVYLLLESKQSDARHEFHNLIRILTLILRLKYDKKFYDYYCELNTALIIRSKNIKQSKGIEITPESAKLWRKKISNYANIE